MGRIQESWEGTKFGTQHHKPDIWILCDQFDNLRKETISLGDQEENIKKDKYSIGREK